jgi:hypothetical protein
MNVLAMFMALLAASHPEVQLSIDNYDRDGSVDFELTVTLGTKETGNYENQKTMDQANAENRADLL